MNQNEIDSMLKKGIIFSILWLAGIGSLIAIIAGNKAKKAINASNGKLQGKGRALWCLIVGGVGLLFWLPIILIGIVNQWR